MQSQDTAWAEDDDAATVADVLAPHFTITNDAQPFATVHSHRLPVPEVGETYIVLGRLARKPRTRPTIAFVPKTPSTQEAKATRR